MGDHARLLRRNRLSPTELLESQMLVSTRPRGRVPKPVVPVDVTKLGRAPRRERTLKEAHTIIYLRFGSLEDFSRPVMGYLEISKRLHIQQSSVRALVIRFCARGHSFERLKPTWPKFKMLSPELQQMLLSPELLQEWAPFTLKERSHITKRVWGVYIAPSHLALFYRTNGVRLRQAKKVFRYVCMNNAALEVDRKAFALTMGNLMVRKRPIIYTDESTFSNQLIKPKSWSLRDHPNQHYIDRNQESVTIYGAVGDALIKNVWHMAKNTN